MLTVNKVSRLTGVSVRTLHHYDSIGLLKPAAFTDAGYRLYDNDSIRRLQNILLFRELQFSLKEIKEILDDPGFDTDTALSQQIKLLELQKKRLSRLIAFARKIQKEGICDMDFKAFDRSDIENYKAEAKAKWGGTAEYREFESKAGSGGCDKDLMDIFAQFGELRGLSPESEQAQEKVAALRQFITQNYYTCSKDILKSLGEMYVGDERFKANIDRAGGKGTAEFVSSAIEVYCSR